MEHGDAMQKELTKKKRHEIIHEFLFELLRSEPELYYEPTHEVSRRLHQQFQQHSKKMSIEDQKLLKTLSVEDIDNVLSFHSKRH